MAGSDVLAVTLSLSPLYYVVGNIMALSTTSSSIGSKRKKEQRTW
jgi:hypothetical protein